MRTYRPKVVLNQLDYSPVDNPLITPRTVETKHRHVRAGRARELVDPLTGEVTALSAIHTVEERDDADFVKIFAEGVRAAYGLSRTGMRVFQAILDEYQRTPMNGGYADAVELFWFNNGLSGREVGMSEYTFKRGLRELLDKGFIAPKSTSLFWVNPALFFKGDRVAFIREYRRRGARGEANSEVLENTSSSV